MKKKLEERPKSSFEELKVLGVRYFEETLADSLNRFTKEVKDIQIVDGVQKGFFGTKKIKTITKLKRIDII